MVRPKAVLVAAALFALAPLASFAATIELKDGTTVSGSIEGTVILGGRIDAKKSRKEPLGGVFFLIDGRDIASITKKGVERSAGGSLFWALFAGKKLPPTPEVLALLWQLGKSQQMDEAIPKGMGMGMVSFSHSFDVNPMGIALMGEYTEENGGSVVPSLRVTTSEGERTIAVADVVEYIKNHPAP